MFSWRKLKIAFRVRDELAGRKHDPEVRITVAREGTDAVLHVIDNGVGIPPESLKRIFLPLFTTKPSDRGTGLGLAIVRRVVEAHGGRVHVRSTPGTGTAFAVAFPLLQRATVDSEFLKLPTLR